MKNFAFTLAELLITLGIIGVVAAMAIPILIQNHKRHSTAVSVKKFYSILTQAIKLSEIDNGPSGQWLKEKMAYDENENLQKAENAQLALKYFNKYLKDYIKYIKIDENPRELQTDNEPAAMIKVYLADGSTFFLNNGMCAHFIFDANGDKKPNMHGKDKFNFLLCHDDLNKKVFLGENNNSNFGPYCENANNCINREAAKLKCETTPNTCANLLMFDGWKFKDDYPIKL